MPIAKPIVLTALVNHRRRLELWHSVIVAGLALFACLLVLSYFVLKVPGVASDTHRYKLAEAILGFGEIASLVSSVVGYFHYSDLNLKFRKQAFSKLLEDNEWTRMQKYNITDVAGILLGAGSLHEEGYAFSGKYSGRTFTSVVFQFDASVMDDSKSRRFLCMKFKLPKAYPMIVIENRSNDHHFKIGSLSDRVPNGVKLNLEGDFNNIYNVSATKGSEKIVLDVLAPDFMAVLEDNAKYDVDLEIADTDLFLIYEDIFYTEKNLEALFKVATSVMGKISKLSATWQASSTNSEVALIAASARSARGRLISKSTQIGAGTVLIFIGYVIAAVILVK